MSLSSIPRSLIFQTPRRTFILFPLIAIAAQVFYPITFAKPYNFFSLTLVLAGFLQYKLCGLYMQNHGMGGRTRSDPPIKLVASGPYRYVRNPMYLGHMEFLLGMALFLDSFVALGLLLVQVTWLAKNVAIDENRLLERYGEKYEEYKNLVPRWIPRLGRGPQRLGASTKGQEA